MKQQGFQKYTLYRWRYYIAYSILGLTLLLALAFAALFLPGGITSQEMTTTIASGAGITMDSVTTSAVVNLPYHALQWLSLTVFDASLLSIKLPSLLLAGLTAVGLLLLLQQWFSRRTSILVTLIAIITSQFLVYAQLGSVDILYIFWPTVILLLGTFVARRKRPRLLWAALLSAAIGLSLYTPLSVYIPIALAVATALHPHLRHVLRKTPTSYLVTGSIVVLLIVTPLIIASAIEPSIILTLLGIPTSMPALIDNAGVLLSLYTGVGTVASSFLMTPIYGIATLLLIIAGFFYMWRHSETVHSHLIIMWLILLLPAVFIQPDYVAVLFIPTILLLAMGLSQLIGTWYKLFPFNPYARVFGLFILVVLVSSIVLFGFTRYAANYSYSPMILSHFSNDLQLLPRDTTQLVVSQDEYEFYSTIAQFREGLTVTQGISYAEDFTATRSVVEQGIEAFPTQIITNDRVEQADRFYLYKEVSE